MPELHVSKKSIGKLLGEMQSKQFIIPDYQRPYKWNIEKCETLWNDIENFTNTEAKEGADYFLGTIVSYLNEDKNQEIIDGQQRITSFFLLLRAFFRKLEDMPQDDQVLGLITKVAPCIWDTDKFSGKVVDSSKIHIQSLVATEEDNETFHRILETGKADENSIDNYSRNYLFFKKECDDYAQSKPMQWKELCVTILNQCIILPIECDTPETALMIFSTLNDRGMPLADSDIFKAQIYRSIEGIDERKQFTELWKDLTQICKEGHVSLDDVFRYYTHVLRARNNDKSKEVGLRKFYAEDKYARLKTNSVINEIVELANFWRYVNVCKEPDEEFLYSISIEARKFLQVLSLYPNDFWKYSVSVFFIKNASSSTFDADFTKILKQLASFLFVKFIHTPSVNAIKDDTYNSCVSIYSSNLLNFKLNFNEELLLHDFDKHHSSRISRALLLLEAYLNPNQTELIPANFDIEHIFPKKWQDTNYNGWSFEDAKLYLDRFGNKIVLEKKLNIRAGNGYFGIKKLRYRDSRIATIHDIAAHPNSDWLKEDIEFREVLFKKNLVTFFMNEVTTE